MPCSGSCSWPSVRAPPPTHFPAPAFSQIHRLLPLLPYVVTGDRFTIKNSRGWCLPALCSLRSESLAVLPGLAVAISAVDRSASSRLEGDFCLPCPLGAHHWEQLS